MRGIFYISQIWRRACAVLLALALVGASLTFPTLGDKGAFAASVGDTVGGTTKMSIRIATFSFDDYDDLYIRVPEGFEFILLPTITYESDRGHTQDDLVRRWGFNDHEDGDSFAGSLSSALESLTRGLRQAGVEKAAAGSTLAQTAGESNSGALAQTESDSATFTFTDLSARASQLDSQLDARWFDWEHLVGEYGSALYVPGMTAGDYAFRHTVTDPDGESMWQNFWVDVYDPNADDSSIGSGSGGGAGSGGAGVYLPAGAAGGTTTFTSATTAGTSAGGWLAKTGDYPYLWIIFAGATAAWLFILAARRRRRRQEHQPQLMRKDQA